LVGEDDFDFQAAVVELTANGSAVTNRTIIGGTGQDQGYGIAVTPAGDVYMSGFTQSKDFPATAPLSTPIDYDLQAFVVKLGAPAFDTVPRSGRTMFGRAPKVDFANGSSLKIAGDSLRSLRVKATVKVAKDVATVVGTDLRTGARYRLRDTENSQTPVE
jgi:hypothetical protein